MSKWLWYWFAWTVSCN